MLGPFPTGPKTLLNPLRMGLWWQRERLTDPGSNGLQSARLRSSCGGKGRLAKTSHPLPAARDDVEREVFSHNIAAVAACISYRSKEVRLRSNSAGKLFTVLWLFRSRKEITITITIAARCEPAGRRGARRLQSGVNAHPH